MMLINITNNNRSSGFETNRKELEALIAFLLNGDDVLIDATDVSTTHDFALRLQETLDGI